jgi:hypothetical protein
LIWATRGRSWGFRFLLDAGLADPLPAYERAFAGLVDAPTVWHRAGHEAALRLPDPQGRRDSAGRVIPHEFVVFGDLAASVDSIDDAIEQIWPLVERAYDRVWDADTSPTSSDLRFDP